MKSAWLVLGDQLFEPSLRESQTCRLVFMKEDRELCTRFKIHKIKIAFFLSAMRHYANELKESGYQVVYQALGSKDFDRPYEEALQSFVTENKIQVLFCYEISDRFFEKRIDQLCKSLGVELKTLRSPQFLVPRENFKKYLGEVKRPFMKTFYERQRKNSGWLMDTSGKPKGGKYSFDEENRSPLPAKGVKLPVELSFKADSIDKEVLKLVEKNFSKHPGSLDHFWIPTDRSRAKELLNRFIADKLNSFGLYEDAIHPSEAFLFHSSLSPLINIGLLTPQEVIEKVVAAFEKKSAPLNSVEGFVRQIIGWREFIFGIDQNFGEEQSKANFWKHSRKLSSAWYTGETGIPPLDDSIRKVLKYSYTHHIERLMIISSLMTLAEIHPQEAYRWFMEMYADSADWVMGPNVYGMGLFSDGGIFATKPYICGSNYYVKMGRYKKGDWCDGVDGLYWSFIDRHRDFYAKNPRTNFALKTLDKMDLARKKKIFRAAESLKIKLTT
jgi:deoxyribodipyrimidine photolyase-related protein